MDIVERLRRDAESARNNWPEVFCVSEDLAEEAADEIERLREMLGKCLPLLSRAHDRIHTLPRATDTELAKDIDVILGCIRATLGEEK